MASSLPRAGYSVFRLTPVALVIFIATGSVHGSLTPSILKKSASAGRHSRSAPWVLQAVRRSPPAKGRLPLRQKIWVSQYGIFLIGFLIRLAGRRWSPAPAHCPPSAPTPHRRTCGCGGGHSPRRCGCDQSPRRQGSGAAGVMPTPLSVTVIVSATSSASACTVIRPPMRRSFRPWTKAFSTSGYTSSGKINNCSQPDSAVTANCTASPKR